MAFRNSSKPSQGGHHTMQKQRSEAERERGRASGGGLRNLPAEDAPGNSASTGGRASKSSLRSGQNSRSSNAGNQSHQKVRRQP